MGSSLGSSSPCCSAASHVSSFPELTAVDDDDLSNGSLTLASNCEASGTADAADFLSLAAPTTLTDDVTKDIALQMSHRGLSRTRKVKALRFQDTVTGCKIDGVMPHAHGEIE